MSATWTEQFVEKVILAEPPVTFITIPGLAMAAFDNLEIHCGYKAFQSQDTTGVSTNYRMELTNWLKFSIGLNFIGPRVADGLLLDIGALPLFDRTPYLSCV